MYSTSKGCNTFYIGIAKCVQADGTHSGSEHAQQCKNLKATLSKCTSFQFKWQMRRKTAHKEKYYLSASTQCYNVQVGEYSKQKLFGKLLIDRTIKFSKRLKKALAD